MTDKRMSLIDNQEKPFSARGSRVIRCQQCQVPADYCICKFKTSCDSQVIFWLLMHRKEQFKPTNTGRLIVDTIKGSRTSIWHRTEPPIELIEALQDPNYHFMVLYPSDENTDIEPAEFNINNVNKKICIIIPDGTWRQASKMMSHSPYLDNLPRLGLWTTQSSGYNLRKAKESYQLCTAEVAIEVLGGFNLNSEAESLKKYYDRFNYNYGVARMGTHGIARIEN